jgi:hypothetical protein
MYQLSTLYRPAEMWVFSNSDFCITKKLRGMDLNHWPPGYEPGELPGCSTPQYIAQKCS